VVRHPRVATYRGKRVITCPTTTACDRRNRREARGPDSFGGSPDLQLSSCSRWPRSRIAGRNASSRSRVPGRLPRGVARLRVVRGKRAPSAESDRRNPLAEHAPALAGPNGETLLWKDVQPEQLSSVFSTHRRSAGLPHRRERREEAPRPGHRPAGAQPAHPLSAGFGSAPSAAGLRASARRGSSLRHRTGTPHVVLAVRPPRSRAARRALREEQRRLPRLEPGRGLHQRRRRRAPSRSGSLRPRGERRRFGRSVRRTRRGEEVTFDARASGRAGREERPEGRGVPSLAAISAVRSFGAQARRGRRPGVRLRGA